MLKIAYKISSQIKLIAVLFLVSILVSGCISITGGGSKQTQTKTGPLGVYKSEDGGGSWKVKNDLLTTSGQKLTIGDLDIKRIVIDPFIDPASNLLTLYLLTSKGMFVSYNAGDSWLKINFLPDNEANDLAVNYFDKCNVYVSAGQSIYRTTDCLRTWQEVYFNKDDATMQINRIATESYNRGVIYAATNKGDILKSVDSGLTWKRINNLGNEIIQILVDKDDTRVIYFVTKTKGIFKTTDGGTTWSNQKKETDLNQALSAFKDAKTGYFLAQDQTQKDSFIFACKYGLLKTNNGGLAWDAISLITAPGADTIYSVAVDPKDNKKIIYGTDNTIYKSVDGGKTWATLKSPSGQIVNYLIYDPKNSKIIYLGNKKVVKK
jgi:photosystem II stability/assembly factor-like uncharacterized protein